MTGIALSAAAVASATAATAGTGAPAAAVGGVWRSAAELHGTGSLNTGGAAEVTSVSCPAEGNCTAGGFYTGGSGRSQAFVADESRGKWHAAVKVPGTGGLNTGGTAAIVSVSCAAPGYCGAGGYYANRAGDWQAFVVTETKGRWGTAEQVRGIGILNAGGHSETETVSCAAPGRCSAGGIYTDKAGRQQAFVVNRTSAGWGHAAEVPGTARLNVGGHAAITSVSCAAAGACSAGGYYASADVDGIPREQAFVIGEAKGRWATATEVPGSGSLNRGGYAAVNSVSCAAAGACSAGGLYTSGKPASQAFVVTEANGVWGTAKVVPGLNALNKTGFAQVSSLSCASPGNCVAGGFYQSASFQNRAFVVSETNGGWRRAVQVPGTAALNQGSGGGAELTAVSCAGVGNCGAGGSYTGKAGNQQVFVISEEKGAWGTAVRAPGTAALNTGGRAAIMSVSCPATNVCTAGGKYTIRKNASAEAFTVSETKDG